MTHGTWPDAATGAFTTWDLTSQDSTKYDVDAKLWDALQAKSPILAMVPRYKVNNFNFHWETDNEPTRSFVCANATSGMEDGPSATNTALVLTGGEVIEKGTILRNASRATPLTNSATYNYADELIEVTANSAGTLTVVRAINGDGTNGSATAVIGDYFEIVWAPKQEGSDADRNKYTDVTIVNGYTSILDFYLEVTGSMAATDKALAQDSLQNQFNKCMVQLQSELEHMLLYGDESVQAGGRYDYVRRTKGLDGWLVGGYANGVVDYSTKAVTEDALNGIFSGILQNNTDPSDRFIIACHPNAARTISTFGADKVQVGIELSKWGRYIDTFKSDLGVTAPVIWTLNCSKSDLFVINLNKIALAEFRPFQTATWSYSDDGGDRWQQRYLGELGVKVVNGTKCHGKLGYLTW